MIWLALLLSEGQPGLTPFTLRNGGEVLTSDDYVTRAAGTGKSGVIVVEILIDPTRKPQSCGLAATSGSSDLDLRACAAGMARGKYTPATDENGVPMYGVVRLRVRRVLERFCDDPKGAPKWPADLVLEVTKLPEGRESLRVEQAYLVDEQGAVQRCSVQQTSGFGTFDTGACATMTKLQHYAPARDKADKAWPVVRTQEIEFTSVRRP